MKNLKFLIAFISILSFLPGKGQLERQVCVIDKITYTKPWMWPAHNNWFTARTTFKGTVINFKTGQTINYDGPHGYEGLSAASDDDGNLLFFSNGRKVWDAAGNVTSTGIKEGNEGVMDNGSASQGMITVRHPLNPYEYYLFTTDDAQSGATVGLNYVKVGTDGNEIQAATRLGNFRTTEGIAATMHANGVDIWIVVQESGSVNIHSYLLKCDGVLDDLDGGCFCHGLHVTLRHVSNGCVHPHKAHDK